MTQEPGEGRNLVTREHLLTAAFAAPIDRIEAHRIQLQPAQHSGSHVHPGGVVGYIVDGDVTFALEGQEATTLHPGDVFHEPAGATISHFDNASERSTVTFIAFYPLAGDEPLIVMGPA